MSTSENKTQVSGGIGVGGLLFVVFTVLKVMDIKPVGDWSWWWVTAPLWGPLAFVLVICLIVVLGASAFRR